MRAASRGALPAVLLVVALLAAGCTDDDPSPEDEALTELLGDLQEDPAGARSFLVADDTIATAEVAEDAGLPEQGRVTALLTDDALQEGAAADDLAATLTAGLSAAGGASESDRARMLREVVLAWEGDPSFDDDVRTAGADVVAADLDLVYDELVRTADEETWPDSGARGFLVDAGGDAESREALQAALLTSLRARLVPTPAGQLEAAADEVGVPAGRLVGALDSDTGDADVLADDREDLTRLLRDWLQRNGADEEQVTNFANDVGRAYAEELD